MKIILLRSFCLISPLLLFAYLPSWADENDGPIPESIDLVSFGEEIEASTLKIDLNTPTVPAAAILGDDSISLSSMRTATDFYSQLLTGFGTDGTLQPGLAIGGSPYWWLNRDETLGEYRATSYPALILKRTQFGLATKSAPDEGTNRTELGVSVSWQLVKKQDPRYNTDGELCLGDSLKTVVADVESHSVKADQQAATDIRAKYPALKLAYENDPEYWQTFLDSGSKEYDEFEKRREELKNLALLKKKSFTFDEKDFESALEKCRTKYSDYLRDTDSLAFTVASKFSSDDGKFDDLSGDKTAFWLSFKSGRKGILKSIKFPVQVFAGYTINEEVELKDSTKQEADRFSLGLGSSLENDNESFDFQVSYVQSQFDPTLENTENYRLTAAYSRRVSDGLWVELKAGMIQSDVLKDSSFAGLSLKIDSANLLGQ